MRTRLVVAMGLWISGCNEPSGDVPLKGTRGVVLHLQPTIRAWHDGAALPAFDEAMTWWQNAGAAIQSADWGYPVDIVSTSLGTDRIGRAGPTEGITINQPLLDEIAAQPDGTAWMADTFAHEIGHVLGCQHVDVYEAAMYAVIHPNTKGLTRADIEQLAGH